jgi:hypothetical protein
MKNPAPGAGSQLGVPSELSRDNAHRLLVQRTFGGKKYIAFNQCKQSVILADADIGSGVELGAALANNDGASANQLTTELLHTEHFRLRVAPISRRAAAFFLCHDPYLLSNNSAD